MKNIIKTLLVVTVLVLALVAFTGCGMCTHEGTTELIPSIIPTCTETGMTIGSKCTACGEIVLAPEVWEARGHDVTEIVETTADCLQGGVEKVYCDFCGDTYTREVEAYGHDLVDTEALAPGCVEDGYTAHKACSRCDYTEGKETVDNLGGHVMEAVEENLAGCVNNPGYYAHNACSVCGHSDDIEYVEYTDDNPGHTFDPEEYFVAVSPTCTEDGLYAGYCLTCGKGYYLGYVPAAHVDEDGDFVCDVEGCGAHVHSVGDDCVCDATDCGEYVHTYDENGVCTVEGCGHVYVDYYLIGWINGADYGNAGDWENLGDYKFVDGKLTVTFTADSYVGVKSAQLDGTIVGWFWSEAYVNATEGTFENGKDYGEKMFVPGGVEVTFTLTVNEDGSLTLSYTTPVVEEGGAE